MVSMTFFDREYNVDPGDMIKAAKSISSVFVCHSSQFGLRRHIMQRLITKELPANIEGYLLRYLPIHNLRWKFARCFHLSIEGFVRL